jgi:hypothetical protein
MGIDAKIESPYSPDARTLHDPQGYVGLVLSMTQLQDTKCLAFVDPYGDTIFNQLQLPVLISELEAVLAEISSRRLRSHKRALAERARSAKWAAMIVEAYEQEASVSDDQLQSEVERINVHMNKVLGLLREEKGSGPHTFVRFLGD